jgi:glutaredoxin
MNHILTIYTGTNCHLCDQAKSLIYPVLQEAGWTLKEINIDDHDDLKQRYGIRIPVMAAPDGKEKGWPFTQGQVKQLIAADE